MFCSKCGSAMGDGAKFCPSCGVAAGAEVMPDAVAQKKGSSAWKWILGVPVALFVAFMALGAFVSNSGGSKSAQQQRVDQACEEMMSDSAPGTERRMTRQICENMKAGR